MEVGEWKLLEPKGEAIKGHHKHSAVIWRDHMYVFGGYAGGVQSCETWSFNLKDPEWKLLSTEDGPPQARSEHSAIVWEDKMIIYGGLGDQGGRLNTWNDTWALDLQRRKWELFSANGELKQRWCHPAVLWNDHMIVCGGFEGGYLCDAWSFSWRRKEWTMLTASIPPGRLQRHSAVLWHDQMLVFGGESIDGKQNKSWMCNLKSKEWTPLSFKDLPPGRNSHSAVVYGDHMIVFSGAFGAPNLNDTWSLDLASKKWKLHNPKGKLPEARFGHSAVLWGNQMVVYGGRAGSDTSREIWSLSLTLPPTAPTPPLALATPRSGRLWLDPLVPTPRQDPEVLATVRVITGPALVEACQAMAALPGNAQVQKWGCLTLSLCAGFESAAAEAKAPKLIIAAMKAHVENAQIQDWGSQALAAFCAGADPESCGRKEQAIAEGALEVLVAASKQAKTKRQAIGALGNLCSGEDAGRAQRVKQSIDAQVPKVLKDALKDDDSSRTIRKVFGALAELGKVAPDQVSSEILELVERALDANAGNQDIQRLGERIQQAAPQRECSKDQPTYWSGHIGDEGWAACPVTGETLSALRTMFVVNHPAELGRGRDADSYPRKYNDLRVHCAWRIEHEDGWDSFALERSKVQKTMKRLRQQGVPVQRWQSKLEEASKSLPGSTYLRETGERFLLHGCSPEVVLGILHSGFDDKVTKKGMFGAGCYFAEDPEKADQYARPDPHHKASGLEELHARLYNGENTHPEGDVFYCFAVRVVCGACVQTKGLDKSRPTKDALSGEEIFFNADLKQLVEIPGTTPPERYHTLVVNPTSESTGRSVYRNREVISFKGAMTYAEYLIAFTRELT